MCLLRKVINMRDDLFLGIAIIIVFICGLSAMSLLFILPNTPIYIKYKQKVKNTNLINEAKYEIQKQQIIDSLNLINKNNKDGD